MKPWTTERILDRAEKRRNRIEHKRTRLLKARMKILAELRASLARTERDKKFVRVPFAKLSFAKQKALRAAGRNFCPVWKLRPGATP